MPSSWLMLSILVIPVATVLGLILLIVNLFHLQWRAATSIVFASAAFALATFGSLKFSDELRWYTLRPYYVDRIEGSPGGSYNIHGVEWELATAGTSREYHETETDARTWQQEQQEWLGSCKRTLKKIAPHYFLNGVYC